MKILSFGGGVQTITLAVMSALGDFERPDIMVFADTGWEPKRTYEYIEWFKEWLNPYGIPLIVRSKGNIRADALTGKRFASMPVFTVREVKIPVYEKYIEDEDGRLEGKGRIIDYKTKVEKGMLMRQCTNEYKVQVVQKAVREYMGVKKFQRVKQPVEMWLGISCDEASRQKSSRIKWIANRYPLIELGYYREYKKDNPKTEKNCIDYLKSKGVPVPPKSACIGCPFHDDTFWAKMMKESPEEFEDACQFDEAIRNSTKQGIRQPIFLHSSRTPLRNVKFKIKDINGFENECEGHCGV